MIERLKRLDFRPTPFTNGYLREELLNMLHTPQLKVWFCSHNWVLWKFGVATRWHRVCSKCYKKQQGHEIVPKHRVKWIRDRSYS